MNTKPIRDMTQADKVIVHIIRRIMSDTDTRWSLGWGTESFRLLCIAYADLVDESFDEVEAFIRDRQAIGDSSFEQLRKLEVANDLV